MNRGARYQAHNAFALLRLLYRWAIGTGEYGIKASPVERLQPGKLIGKLELRDRVLKDDELRRVWDAAGEMGYPYGPLFRLLILTGLREREVANASWPEFDLQNRLWTIPASRMKGDRAHEIPLADRALAAGRSPAAVHGRRVPVLDHGRRKARQRLLEGEGADRSVERCRGLEDPRSAPDHAHASLGAAGAGPGSRARHRARQAGAAPGL